MASIFQKIETLKGKKKCMCATVTSGDILWLFKLFCANSLLFVTTDLRKNQLNICMFLCIN